MQRDFKDLVFTVDLQVAPDFDLGVYRLYQPGSVWMLSMDERIFAVLDDEGGPEGPDPKRPVLESHRTMTN